jgi:hypothetical protein
MPVKNQIQFLSLVAKELPDPFLGIHLAEGIELREIAFTRCSLYPRKRTSLSAARMSAECQKRRYCNAEYDQLAATHPPSTNSVCPVHYVPNCDID